MLQRTSSLNVEHFLDGRAPFGEENSRQGFVIDAYPLATEEALKFPATVVPNHRIRMSQVCLYVAE